MRQWAQRKTDVKKKPCRTIFELLNYFSHFYFDGTDDIDYNFGLLLPDFVRNFIPKQKYVLNTKKSDAISLGAQQHFKRDHVFHMSQVFEEMQEKMKPYVVGAFARMKVNRSFFVNHILCEMMIDRALIKEDPTKIDEMYRQLNLVTDKNRGLWVSEHQPNHLIDFLRRLERFNELKYIKRYVEDQAMAYSINRVCMYVKVCNEWSLEQSQEFLKIIKPVESIIFERISDLKTEMSL